MVQMKKVLLVFHIFLVCNLYAQFGKVMYMVGENCLLVKNEKLEPTIHLLQQVVASRNVVEKALCEGSIFVDISSEGMPFGAMWECSGRQIIIDRSFSTDPSTILRYLLFELHNAISESKYQELYEMAANAEIDCETYVETIEKIEHENMIDTVSILEKGISMGVFPESVQWEMIHDFAIHYKIQQLTGHSLQIAKEYQDISKNSFSLYKGTVENLEKMSQSEKRDLALFLYQGSKK